MSVTASLFLFAAAGLAAPAPAKARNQWVGVVVCCKTSSPEQYQLMADGSFELQRFPMRYLDVRCVDEKGDYIAVQHDDTVFWVKKETALRPQDAINYYT